MHRIFYRIVLFLTLIAVICFTIPSVTWSAESFDLYKYEQFVNEGRYHLAEDYLLSKEDIIISNVTRERPTMKQTVQEYLDKNKEILASEEASHQNKITATLQFIVLYDAAINDEASLWHVWKENLEHNLSRIMEGSPSDEKVMEDIAIQVEVLSPILAIHYSQEEINAWNQEVLTADKPMDHQQLQAVYQEVSSFDIHEIRSEQFQFYLEWLLFIVVGCLFLSLSYVGWVKYKAEVKDN
ncbi:Na+/phosphate symporter [Gracilibacillus halotolerans]|uniref:Na+/phosphate symporter n=1 Tax=Gracilibacillus halotolerans TaxID=74386 RepID=A0A841RIE3_9BACI|nr:sporulation protein YpjB [Gracilibacillus halotolerans]MBB6511637.1 Na+/phosphate symporter [Gracilibacillus halotolerans]